MPTPRLLAALALASSLAGCGGERALRWGWCPAGETCSDATPAGLEFRGAWLSDAGYDAVKVTAVGGVQTIHLTDVRTQASLAVPWRAELSGALAVDREEATAAVIRGESEGESLLRIVDPDTGELFDRTRVRATSIDATALLAIDEQVSEGARIGWIAGAEPELAVALRAGDGGATVEPLGWLVRLHRSLAGGHGQGHRSRLPW